MAIGMEIVGMVMGMGIRMVTGRRVVGIRDIVYKEMARIEEV